MQKQIKQSGSLGSMQYSLIIALVRAKQFFIADSVSFKSSKASSTSLSQYISTINAESLQVLGNRAKKSLSGIAYIKDLISMAEKHNIVERFYNTESCDIPEMSQWFEGYYKIAS